MSVFLTKILLVVRSRLKSRSLRSRSTSVRFYLSRHAIERTPETVKGITAAVVACALLSGCSTRGNLTAQQLAVLKREKATLEVQSGRCKDFGPYAAEQLFRARDEDRAACDLKCHPDFTPAQRKEEQEIELGGPGFNFYGLPVSAKQDQSCFERFAECRGPIFEAVRRRLDEENPAPSVAKPSELQDSMDKVEFDDTRSRCEYLDDEIRDLDSRIYYGDPRNCAGPTPKEMKEWRQLARLNKQDMAAHLGISPAYVTYLENGVRSPSASVIARYRKFSAK